MLWLIALFSASIPDFTAAVDAVRPAVVRIVTDRVAVRPDSGMSAARSLGSGFVIDTLGHILTCNHVVAGYDELAVWFADGTSCEGREVVVVGRDPATDLAVIKVRSARRFTPVRLGNSDELEVGQWVVAIGSPFGLQGSASAGIVSGLSRWGLAKSSGPDFQDFIQTDALINPGNSGGPLIDVEGRVVGVASFTKTAESEFTGIGFCTPVNLAVNVATELIRHGGVVRGYLGVNTQPLTKALRQVLGVMTGSGVLVASVASDGPAQEAGIRPGDVILELDSKPVQNVRSFQTGIAGSKPGAKVKLKVLRRGERLETEAVLKAWPMAGTEPAPAAASRDWPGIVVRGLTDVDRAKTRLSAGIVVEAVEPAGAAYDAGLRPGDAIVEANFSPVADKAEFDSAVAAVAKTGRVLLLRVWRGRTAFYVALEH
ncbi:MAG: trypsin-like peptidase domain-containing protein [candidate division WOR-3 bacterium]